jgi:LruC domain-containing protein
MKFYVNGQMKSSSAVTGLLRNNNRPFSIGSDGGNQKFVNGLIDEVILYNNALTGEEINTLYNTLPNVDADGDGVLNIDDDYPDDPLRAFDNFYPASGFGSLAFEDLWPSQGDYDFNDLILDYQFKTVTSSANLVAEIYATINIKAIGAGYKNGFGFQLNQNFPSANIQVSGYELTESYANIGSNGTETGQAQTTIIVFDNASKLLVSQGGFGVNVNPDNPWIAPYELTVLMDFSDATYTAAQIDIQNWNPFLIANGERGKEIHLADHQPTSLAESSYFGTFEDNTIPAEDIYYKTLNNLPWAIEFPVAFDYPIEKHEISTAHLKFLGWAESAGVNFNDWYLDLPGYRNPANVYFHAK